MGNFFVLYLWMDLFDKGFTFLLFTLLKISQLMRKLLLNSLLRLWLSQQSLLQFDAPRPRDNKLPIMP